MEAAFKGSAAAVLRLRLTTGEAILEVQCADGAGFVEVRSPARYVVVPDYFGDDLIYGGQSTREFWLPAENFCLNLLEGQEAMMMSVWQSGGPEALAWLHNPAATGENPGLASSTRVRCLKGKSLWLAFLESPGLWHSRSGLAEDGWKPPFPAKWRATFAGEMGWPIRGTWTAAPARSRQRAPRCPAAARLSIPSTAAQPRPSRPPVRPMSCETRWDSARASTSWPARAWRRG